MLVRLARRLSWPMALLLALLVFGLVVSLGGNAFADTGTHTVAGYAVPDYWINFVIGVGIPAVVAFVNKRYAKAWWDAVVCLLLSAVGGLLSTWLVTDSGTWDWRNALVGAFFTFITAVAAHYGVLQHIGITGNDGVIRQALPGGVGPAEDVANSGALIGDGPQ